LENIESIVESETTPSETIESIVESETTPSENIESIVESETTPLEPVATEIPAEKTTPDISPESLIKQLGEFLSRFHLPFLNPVQVTSNSPIPSPEIVDQVSISEPVTKPQRSENINLVPELP
jgi:hypothetical protein